MRAKYINEFERGVDPKVALGIGRVAKIRNLFKSLNIPDENYEITPTGVIREMPLNLKDTNVDWLPDGLEITGYLDLSNTPITELPKGLKIKDSEDYYSNLVLYNVSITELPDDLEVEDKIYLYKKQEKLINYIENSKFADKLSEIRN